jgi:hypothetical protein
VAPNPVKRGEIAYIYAGNAFIRLEASILDVSAGKIAQIEKASAPLAIETKGFAPGIYIIRIQAWEANTRHSIFVRKLIVI